MADKMSAIIVNSAIIEQVKSVASSNIIRKKEKQDDWWAEEVPVAVPVKGGGQEKLLLFMRSAYWINEARALALPTILSPGWPLGMAKGKDITGAAHSLFAGNLAPLAEWDWNSMEWHKNKNDESWLEKVLGEFRESVRSRVSSIDKLQSTVQDVAFTRKYILEFCEWESSPIIPRMKSVLYLEDSP